MQGRTQGNLTFLVHPPEVEVSNYRWNITDNLSNMSLITHHNFCGL